MPPLLTSGAAKAAATSSGKIAGIRERRHIAVVTLPSGAAIAVKRAFRLHRPSSGATSHGVCRWQDRHLLSQATKPVAPRALVARSSSRPPRPALTPAMRTYVSWKQCTICAIGLMAVGQALPVAHPGSDSLAGPPANESGSTGPLRKSDSEIPTRSASLSRVRKVWLNGPFPSTDASGTRSAVASATVSKTRVLRAVQGSRCQGFWRSLLPLILPLITH